LKKQTNKFSEIQSYFRRALKESNESHSIYIAVDSKKVARCDWCGTAESENWWKYQRQIFCSANCTSAAKARDDLTLGFVGMVIGPLIAIPFAYVSLALGIGFATLVMILASVLVIAGRKGLDLQQKIVRGSRKQEKPTGLTLLRSVASTVSCPNCDGNIDLTKVSEDMVYTCGYCGASGTIEILQTDKD
jgi:hypothetical protein